MKFWILTLAFVTFAEAGLFEVKEDNTTCLLLQLNGSVILTPSVAGEKPVELSFENASVITNSSSCTLIRLNLTESVEVWFEFTNVSKGEWSVTPFAQLDQSVFFNETFNGTVTYKGLPLEETFNRTESYQCIANSTLTFDSKEVHNISVAAAVSNFRIQSVNKSTFVPGKHCKEDLPIPSPPTPTPTTTPTTTTPEPSQVQNFSCSYNGTTKFRVIGTFSLSVTYNATVAGKIESKTVTVEVPKVPASETSCSSESNESLTFKFFGNWSIEYTFQSKDGKKYYISNITITYDHDEHLPNSTSHNKTATVHFSKPDYLEASTSGYYTCQAKTSLAINEVTLHTEGFKYKAFNDKGNITFTSGEVTECPRDEQTSSVVPIAVGAALAGLVVIVLIAYLIGRRRSRKAGYESV